MSPPRVSVIVPVCNAHDHLGEALDSIRRQEVPPSEVIVVDDGSNPPVRAIVQAQLPDATLIEQGNAGPSAARNRGLMRACGELVAFLDADDRWTPNALGVLAKGFRDAPGADVVQGLVRSFHDPGETRWNVPAADRRPYVGFNVGAMMVRRRALHEAGLFDEALRHSEDVDLFMRLQDGGAKRLVIPRLVLEYRRHAASLTAREQVGARRSARNWIGLLHDRRARAHTVAARARTPVSPPPISVILAVRNGRKYLPAALGSIRRQSLAPIEILAIVGASQDDTLDYLRSQADVRVVEQDGLGLAAARNQGLSAARGDLIAFFDHDDLWDDRKLERQVRSIALFTGPAASISMMRLMHDARPGGTGRADDPIEQLPRIGWTPSALLAHRGLFKAIGPFDPGLGIGCDTDWFRRLQASGLPCALVPQALLRKRIHDNNLSNEPLRNRAAMFQMLKKHRAARRGT
ncbi:MAG TPA: glycosyltransferase family A protein [Allosphingosinicella sp.]|nr:glycosyltransferase family A protein [Allosphingosinicella sp.]